LKHPFDVAGSCFPRFDRNLNTGEDPATSLRIEIADNAVYHDGRYSSHLMLPVL
jgi:predicted acyl esterase